MDKEALELAAKDLHVTVEGDNPPISKQLLVDRINELIQSDFHQLISLLYRLDVSEEKLKLLLKENPGEDAGLIIADLIIERQIQKIKSRRQFSQRDDNIDEEEKW